MCGATNANSNIMYNLFAGVEMYRLQSELPPLTVIEGRSSKIVIV